MEMEVDVERVGSSWFIGLALLAILTAGVYAGSVRAASEPGLVADLEGQPIPAVEVGRYWCEDADFPRIHCYRSLPALDAAVRRRGPDQTSSEPNSGTSALASYYVRIFADKGYLGEALYLSAPYHDLSDIGWNDRISSFYGVGGSGTFYPHIYEGGAAYRFGAYDQVTYVGDVYNDQFSSVKPGW